MAKPKASKLSNRAADFYRGEALPDHLMNAINTALFMEAENLPENATAAVIEHPEGLPLIVAATDSHLYAIEVEDDMEEAPPVGVRTTMRRLDPERCTVSVHRRASKSWGEVHYRSVWRFQVVDLAFEVETRSGEDVIADERELFARRLARSIGWEATIPFGDEEGGLSAVA